MSKLLVIGLGPLLEEGVHAVGGQCLRTWHFAKPLLDDGHDVHLLTLPTHLSAESGREPANLIAKSCEGFHYESFNNSDFDYIHRTLVQITGHFKPDAIVGVNMVPSWVAAALPLKTPLWADLNGYEMAEKQGQAARTHTDDPLVAAWAKESRVARRADKFSTVSRHQLHALLGEMAGLGRMNRLTFNYHFAHHIPNAYHPAFAKSARADAPKLRGTVVPNEAFVLLWSGGYNYWTDPSLLFEAIERSMAGNEQIHYVSTGGAIGDYNTTTYEEFCAMIETSPHRDRYHLLGWVASEDLPAIYHESDLGLNIDEPNYETFFGARNRLNNMMASGTAVLTTYGSEISRLIEDACCGAVCLPDAQKIASRILELATDRAGCRAMGARAREFTLEEFDPGKLTKALREWAMEPRLAPDNEERLRISPNAADFLDVPLNDLNRAAALGASEDVSALLQAKVDLEAIKRKKLWPVLAVINRLFGSAK